MKNCDRSDLKRTTVSSALSLVAAIALLGACGDAGDNGGGGGESSGTNSGSGGAATPLEHGDNFVWVARYTDTSGNDPGFNHPPLETLDMQIVGDHIYACTSPHGLLTIDKNSLVVLGQTKPLAYGSRCQYVVADGDRLLTSNRGDEFSPTPHVSLWNATNPAAPIAINTLLPASGSPEGLAVLSPGVYAVAMHDEGVVILNSSGDQLTEIARIEDFNNAWELQVSGDHLYVAAENEGLGVIDVSVPSQATLLRKVALGGSVKHLELGDDETLFASAGSAGVHVLSLSDPSTPTLLASYDSPGSALMSAYADGYLFVADWNDVRILDVKDPKQPKLIGTETIPPEGKSLSRVLALDAEGDMAFLGEWSAIYKYQLLPNFGAADIDLNAFELQFAKASVGQESAMSLIVSNEGPMPLNLSEVNTTGPFSALTTTLTVEPGQKDFIEVRFQPTSTNEASGQLTLLSDDPDEANVVIGLSGNSFGLGPGDEVYDWTWVDLQNGNPISTSGQAGNVLVLSYFATF